MIESNFRWIRWSGLQSSLWVSLLCFSGVWGCESSTSIPQELRPKITMIHRSSHETRDLQEIPESESEDWLPALWCPKCEEWKPMPPGNAWQQNPALRICSKHKTPLFAERK